MSLQPHPLWCQVFKWTAENFQSQIHQGEPAQVILSPHSSLHRHSTND